MDKHIKISSGRTLSQVIDSIISESLKSQLYQNGVAEKQKQSEMLDEEDDDLDLGADKPSKTIESEKDKLKKGDIGTEDVVSKLNTIRGGKSFKDEAISNKLDQYVKSLSKAERIALYAFLKGLSQIVTGEVEADEAIDPSDPPSGVEMEKTGGKKEVKLKPNVIRAPKKEKEKSSEKKTSSKEDTSGPVPIAPVSKKG